MNPGSEFNPFVIYNDIKIPKEMSQIRAKIRTNIGTTLKVEASESNSSINPKNCFNWVQSI